MNIGPVFSHPDKVTQLTLLNEYGLTKDGFVLFNAGSGGHRINNKMATDIFVRAAAESFKETGILSVIVLGANYHQDSTSLEGVIKIPQLNNEKFINMLVLSKAVVLSGGDTLLQAMTLHKPILSIPISKDQKSRISACISHNLILTSKCRLESMVKATKLLLEPEKTKQLTKNLKDINLKNGLDFVIKDIKTLITNW